MNLLLAAALVLSPLVALAHGMAQDGQNAGLNTGQNTGHQMGQHHRMAMAAMDHAQAGHAGPHHGAAEAAVDDPASLAACASICLLLASFALPAQPAALPSAPVQTHEGTSVRLPSPTGAAPPLQPPRALSA
ncbi:MULTISPECIES: hypothetical protein [unclassified Pannonibacter]|uniref:hypothetical protein n=1 Tax=unclassified Pannonibacter TaxID=2627228 RepID=UPI0016474052|nr:MULTISPECIES: hypothetical protein [unclassified Pannonibacter]